VPEAQATAASYWRCSAATITCSCPPAKPARGGAAVLPPLYRVGRGAGCRAPGPVGRAWRSDDGARRLGPVTGVGAADGTGLI
jgi:hypothetical protein